MKTSEHRKFKIIEIYLLMQFLLLLQSNLSFGNSAQPGLWGAGGAGTFSLLYPEDSAHFKKIQMVKELVTIKLFDGYAAIKGSYWMYNTTNQTVNIKTGYPVNSIFESQQNFYKTDVRFDDLYKLKAFINRISVSYIKEPLKTDNRGYRADNWYTWSTEFVSNDTTLIQVYFLVKTRGATIVDGYSHEAVNGFIYLLESGSTWKQPIIEGRIQVQLDHELTIENIKGVSPKTIFKWNADNRILVTDFKNLSPTPVNDIIISYAIINDKIDFEGITKNYNKYFQELDALEKRNTENLAFNNIGFLSPFDSKALSVNPITLMVLGPIILVVLLILLIVFIVRYLRRKKSK